jgi:hypothetical protein
MLTICLEKKLMREYRYEKIYPGLKKEAIWSLWCDVDHWSHWDRDTEFAKLSGPFEVGSSFVLKPRGAPRFTIHLVDVQPLQKFTDLTKFPFAKMYDLHEMEETPQGLKLMSKVWVEGALSWLWANLVAKNVAAGVPAQLDALARFAGQS